MNRSLLSGICTKAKNSEAGVRLCCHKKHMPLLVECFLPNEPKCCDLGLWMCLICNQLHLTSCTAAFSVVYFWRDVMLEMVLFISEMLPATLCALLMSHAAPAFMFAHWQSCQFDVWNKAANSKQCSETKFMVWVGIEGLHGQNLMTRKGWSGCWSDAIWSGKGREERKGECDLFLHL